MYSLPNLSSQALTRGILPWDYKPEGAIPEQVRKDKKLRDTWINNPQTKHQVYTFNEGINANLRISEERVDGGGNPIRCEYAAVADYDSAQPLERVSEYAKSLPYMPNRIERTLSGNWRFVWWYEEEILFPSHKFHKHFKKAFADFAFDVARGMVGFDQKAWESPNRMWTNGCEWHAVHDEPIPAAVTRGWLVKASASFKFTVKEFGPSIPLEEVKAALEAKYESFKKWDVDFVLNAQGPTFWIDGSTSPKSAIVREQGIQTFSAHAAKGFYSWADLLGIDFVKNYQAEEVGRAVENIFFDGHDYWRRSLNGLWQNFDKAATILHLEMSRGLSSKIGPDGKSPIKAALEYIHNVQRVVEAGPTIYRPSGLLFQNGSYRLNTCDVKVLAPAEGPAEVWGPTGNFPWLSKASEIAPAGIAHTTFIAWQARAYQHAYRQEPVAGQVLFLCGPAAVGKSLWNREIMGRMFGGFAEANSFLSGDDIFNREMFYSGFWCLDDGTPSANAAKRQIYSHILKRIAANSFFRVNGKFLQASLVEWLGRLCVTCNDDEESIKLMPDATVSNKDKLILIRTTKTAPIVWPTDKEIKEILDRELPHYCRYLLDYEIPAEVRGANRYGIKPHHDPSLLEISEQASPLDSFHMIVKLWLEHHFNENPEASYWEGTAIELHRNLLIDPFHEKMMRGYSITSAPGRMRFLERIGAAVRIEGKPLWRINRPETDLAK
jgi:hypothetical protein